MKKVLTILENKIPSGAQRVVVFDNEGNEYFAVWKDQFVFVENHPDRSKVYLTHWMDLVEYINTHANES